MARRALQEEIDVLERLLSERRDMLRKLPDDEPRDNVKIMKRSIDNLPVLPEPGVKPIATVPTRPISNPWHTISNEKIRGRSKSKSRGKSRNR
jgi:hypothetical protein